MSSLLLLSLSCLATSTLAASVQVNAPSAAPGDNVTAVFPNFMGISLELSFINDYFGNDTASIPQSTLNYLAALHQRGGGQPVRLRLGGNSMDSSTYIPDQQQVISFTDPTANVNDQPVTYGQVLFDIMKTTSDTVNSQWLMGLSLRDANSTNTPLVAGDAQKILGDDFDAALLGNEPDLYTAHGNRPLLANYTVNDYIGDYWVATENLGNTTDGDFLSLNKISGPTICCSWDFESVLTSGWLDDFSSHLKYLTLQHYPQDHCFGSYKYHLDYYMSHTNTVNLAQWQGPALAYLSTLPPAQRKPLLMDEFNSASCGGIPESNMFGMALWTADYALQMASVGYSAAYLHTRERGVLYNLFDPPAVAGGAWTTNPNFYAMLAVNEALQSAGGSGSRVVDLNVGGSVTDYSAVQAGYAVYDAKKEGVSSVVLFNYANASMQSTDFVLPASLFSAAGSGEAAVRYMTAGTATETTQLTWGNLTYAGVGDGTAVTAPATLNAEWTSDKTVSCSGGCTVQVPGPGMAVVFVAGAPSNMTSDNGTMSSTAGGHATVSAGSATETGAATSLGVGAWAGGVIAAVLCVLAL
ncbi:glycoside hydrolase family 79 protein [Cytidiella melzeri]|nr:glycoside hydrolase family 79 protein [Cytidiella melzeri]